MYTPSATLLRHPVLESILWKSPSTSSTARSSSCLVSSALQSFGRSRTLSNRRLFFFNIVDYVMTGPSWAGFLLARPSDADDKDQFADVVARFEEPMGGGGLRQRI